MTRIGAVVTRKSRDVKIRLRNPDKLETNSKDHIVYFDNFFTSYTLLRDLRQAGYPATGTVREGRTKKCPLVAVKDMKKKNRADFDYRFDHVNQVLFVRWLDNSFCTMGSNFDSVLPLGKVKRWSAIEKQKSGRWNPAWWGWSSWSVYFPVPHRCTWQKMVVGFIYLHAGSSWIHYKRMATPPTNQRSQDGSAWIPTLRRSSLFAKHRKRINATSSFCSAKSAAR